MTSRGLQSPSTAESECSTVRDVYTRHRNFVWLTLQRLGVHPADLEDQLHEVFLVVHRRWGEFEHRAQVTTWLFHITARVVAAWRRRAHRRHESLTDAPPEHADPPQQDSTVADNHARRLLAQVLDAMEPERRVVFVMTMVEGMSQPDIATQLGIPVGTVYSRLHAAREEFEARLSKLQRKERVR